MLKTSVVCLTTFFSIVPKTRNYSIQKDFTPTFISIHIKKFQQKSLPSVKNWTNFLQDAQVSTILETFQHAAKVFQTFGCQNLGSYQDFHLTTDTLLLACVVEQFRKVTYSKYGLDIGHYYTCSHLSGDAFLEVSKGRVEMLTDRSQLEMAENLIRGGVSPVFSGRLARKNSNYLE